MEHWRGFHYQTGEIAELVAKLKADKHARADIDDKDEIDIFNTALAKQEIHPDKEIPADYRAVDLNENPDFFARFFYNTPFGKISIDYFLVDQHEESYMDIFWG